MKFKDYIHYLLLESRMKSAVVLLSLCAVISVSGEFFHGPSFTTIRPSGDTLNSDFGFSIAYQNSSPAKLIVGAPREDFVGKVYSCPITDVSKDISCSVVDMTSLNLEENSKFSREKINKNQRFYFGSSVAATSDYFLTCAPLLTKHITYAQWYKKFIKESNSMVAGACFVHDGNEYKEWQDNCVKLENTIPKYKYRKHFIYSPKHYEDIVGGGLGVSTLADPENGYMIVAKTPSIGDILYVDINNPLDTSNSLLEDYYNNNNVIKKNLPYFDDYYTHKLTKYYNFGYGMTVGKFFNQSVNYYAFSLLQFDLKGMIMFLEKVGDKLDIKQNRSIETMFMPYYIEDRNLGSMFGYALGAVDLTDDGLSELLVGAPAQSSDKNQKEIGALHIYTGGDVLSINNLDRKWTILGNKENSRFGSAIATNDIDNDNIPEIFVSAPYENSEAGVVYVISGYELNLFLRNGLKQAKVSDLKRTQKLQGNRGLNLFGFSLHVVQDVDKNGCNELAIGIPANNSVQLLRCLPAVTASTSLELLGDDKIVKINATEFTVAVSLIVNISSKCHNIVGSISVNYYVLRRKEGDVTEDTILENQFIHELTTQEQQYIKQNVIVNLLEEEIADYTFSTKISVLDVDKNGDRREKDYKPWAVLSSQSKEENNIFIKRYCDGKECEPIFAYEMFWSGGDIMDTSTSKNETLLITVNNTGHNAKEAHVKLTVDGIKISRLPERCIKTSNLMNEYMCSLPKPMLRGSSYNLTVLLDTSKPTNTPNLYISAQLYDTVFPNNTYPLLPLTIPYQLESELVLVNGSIQNLTVTDKSINDADSVTFSCNHEFNIFNNGSVLWNDITASLEIKKEAFIRDVKILATKSCQQHDGDKFKFHCNLTISPGAYMKIMANIEISKENLKNYITDGKLFISSELSLSLQPTNDTRLVTSTTQLTYQKVLTVGNDKTLVIIIAVAVTSIVLLILVFVLYKFGFFKRAEKQKLEVLQENVRKRSVRIASESSRGRRPSAGSGIDCDIEVVEEVFQEVDITPCPQSTKDDVVLIEDTAS